jgi:hypothetical protein
LAPDALNGNSELQRDKTRKPTVAAVHHDGIQINYLETVSLNKLTDGLGHCPDRSPSQGHSLHAQLISASFPKFHPKQAGPATIGLMHDRSNGS